MRMWYILNVKSPCEGRNLEDPVRYPINSPDDERLNYLARIAASLKLTDNSKKGQRVGGLTVDTANAWHVSLLGLVDLTKSLLGSGMKYICLGKIQSDRIEGEFGVISQLSDGNYLVSVEQVISSLSLRRLKLYHKLHVDTEEMVSNENVCCSVDLSDKVEDIETLDYCFSEASNVSGSERSSLYFICGYVTFKEILVGADVIEHSDESEFTELVSRGKLKHPPIDLYDLSQYLYSFFKTRKPKYCSKIFFQAFQYIYESSGYEFPNVESILKRFINCFFKGYAKDETDRIRAEKGKNDRKNESSMHEICFHDNIWT